MLRFALHDRGGVDRKDFWQARNDKEALDDREESGTTERKDASLCSA